MSKISWICAVLAVACLSVLIAMDLYVADLTHGCYNILDILFM